MISNQGSPQPLRLQILTSYWPPDVALPQVGPLLQVQIRSPIWKGTTQQDQPPPPPPSPSPWIPQSFSQSTVLRYYYSALLLLPPPVVSRLRCDCFPKRIKMVLGDSRRCRRRRRLVATVTWLPLRNQASACCPHNKSRKNCGLQSRISIAQLFIIAAPFFPPGALCPALFISRLPFDILRLPDRSPGAPLGNTPLLARNDSRNSDKDKDNDVGGSFSASVWW